MRELKCDPVEVADHVLTHGPKRVVVDVDKMEPLAVGYRRAREQYDIAPDFVLIRNDGWTLGSPEPFALAAYSVYPDLWIGFMVEGSSKVYGMREWNDRKRILDWLHNEKG